MSILAQTIPPGSLVNIVVIDDGSPAPAAAETDGLEIKPPFELTILHQQNSGVAAARNAGLRAVAPDTDYTAFLDSDDIWFPHHLARALEAMSQGFDLYFANNKRTGHHHSYFHKCCPKLLDLVKEKHPQQQIVPILPSQLIPLILEHFPTQASSVVYCRSSFPDHFFPEMQKHAGEDLIFFTSLAAAAKNPCFNPEVTIECGQGINMYFSNLTWDSPKLLAIIADQIRAFLFMKQTLSFDPEEDALVRSLLAFYRKNFVFHATRRFIKNKGKVPPELTRLAHDDKDFTNWFAGYFIYVSLGKPLRLFKPR
ncbi:MAG: glycosyltransferase [Rhodomicrobium sp.]